MAQTTLVQIGLNIKNGSQYLVSEWKELFSKEYLKGDFLAALTVACVALPLVLAISQASHVPPEVGLLSAIVLGLLCSLFGGTTLAISSPAAAMSVVLSTVVYKYGLTGAALVGMGCGILQILTSILGWGQAVRFIPTPVVSGFTAGIGAIILVGEIPQALGLPAVPMGIEGVQFWNVIQHTLEHLRELDPTSTGLTLATIASVLLLPKIFPRVPSVIIAVAVLSAFATAMGLETPRLSEIPRSLPTHAFPSLEGIEFWGLLKLTGLTFFIASLESLLASSAIDRLSGSDRWSSPNQELVGQGLGNFVSGLLGGIPGSAVIARSSVNIQAGAKTRRAAVLHALFLFATVYLLAPIFTHIPLAVLSGVLITVAARMMRPRRYLTISKSSRAEGIVYLITVAGMLLTDLILGVQLGILAALILIAFRYCRIEAHIYSFDKQGPCIVSLSGTLSFLAFSKIGRIQDQLNQLDLSRGVIIDMSRIRSVDVSGALRFGDFIAHLRKQNVRFALRDTGSGPRDFFVSLKETENLRDHFAINEEDCRRVLGDTDTSNFNRLSYGVERFHQEVRNRFAPIFNSLSDSQAPHTLFITCSDSRINPNLITTTDPGELFIVRNVGNIVPAYGEDDTPAEGAAIEYALEALKVQNIVLCGHLGCGAMKAVHQTHVLNKPIEGLPVVSHWLEQAAALAGQVKANTSVREITEMNLTLQMKNILTYPMVQKGIKEGRLQLHTWLYDIGASELQEWSESTNSFSPHRTAQTFRLERLI